MSTSNDTPWEGTFYGTDECPDNHPLGLDVVFQRLLSPPTLNKPAKVILHHRALGKYVLCVPVVNPQQMAARIRHRLRPGKQVEVLQSVSCPVFCPCCYTLLRNQQTLLQHLFDDDLTPCRSDMCLAMQTTTRVLAQALSKSTDVEDTMLKLQKPAHYCIPILPITTDAWMREAGDFAHWVNFHLQTQRHLHLCPLCPCAFSEHDQVTEHLHRTCLLDKQHRNEPARGAPPYHDTDKIRHLLRLTGAFLPKLIPGNGAPTHSQWFRGLLGWANLTRGTLLTHYAQAMCLHKYLLRASRGRQRDLVAAIADILGSQLTHSWAQAGHEVQALKIRTTP